jgi:hypothetical protein
MSCSKSTGETENHLTAYQSRYFGSNADIAAVRFPVAHSHGFEHRAAAMGRLASLGGARTKMESNNQKQEPYSPPTLRKLTLEQAKKLVADRQNCSEEEAADLLEIPPTTEPEH